MKIPTINDCSIIELSQSPNLTIRGNKDIPFEVKRIFYSYNIPCSKSRGAHAHKLCHQFLIAPCGSYEVVLNDGFNKRTIILDNPSHGLYIPPMIWASEQNFSKNSICFVFASHEYEENDYIRNYEEYLESVKNGQR